MYSPSSFAAWCRYIVGIGIDAGDVAHGLAGSHAACIVGEADAGGAAGCSSQASAVAPAQGPPGAVVIADRITGDVIGDELIIYKSYHTITCFTMHMTKKAPGILGFRGNTIELTVKWILSCVYILLKKLFKLVSYIIVKAISIIILALGNIFYIV